MNHTYDFYYSTRAGHIWLTSDWVNEIALRPLADRQKVELSVPELPLEITHEPVLEKISYLMDEDEKTVHYLTLASIQPHHEAPKHVDVWFLDARYANEPFSWNLSEDWEVDRVVVISPSGGYFLGAYEALRLADEGKKVLWVHTPISTEMWIDYFSRFLCVQTMIPGGWA